MSPKSKALAETPSKPKSSGGREGAVSGINILVDRGLLFVHGDTLFDFGRPFCSTLLLPKGSRFMACVNVLS